jgi:hypothetical protein
MLSDNMLQFFFLKTSHTLTSLLRDALPPQYESYYEKKGYRLCGNLLAGCDVASQVLSAGFVRTAKQLQN